MLAVDPESVFAECDVERFLQFRNPLDAQHPLSPVQFSQVILRQHLLHEAVNPFPNQFQFGSQIRLQIVQHHLIDKVSNSAHVLLSLARISEFAVRNKVEFALLFRHQIHLESHNLPLRISNHLKGLTSAFFVEAHDILQIVEDALFRFHHSQPSVSRMTELIRFHFHHFK